MLVFSDIELSLWFLTVHNNLFISFCLRQLRYGAKEVMYTSPKSRAESKDLCHQSMKNENWIWTCQEKENIHTLLSWKSPVETAQ